MHVKRPTAPSSPAKATVAAVTLQSVPQSGSVAASHVSTGATSSAAPRAEELEAFLINFVVEQTGYPSEVVDLEDVEHCVKLFVAFAKSIAKDESFNW